jgi:TolB-like protein/class 3 adenylate cyclase
LASRPERRLAAILVADVVGYSRMAEADEPATIAAIKALHTEVVEPLLAEHKGRVVKLLGDGLIAEFGSVVDAVGAAVALESALSARQENAATDRRLVLRIGINLGDVIVDGDDLLGDGVNIAARLEQLCEPGGVLISGTAYDHLQGKLDLVLQDAGEQHVKNLSRPVRTYRVAPEGVRRRPAPSMRRRWVVLPIVGATILLALAAGMGLWWWQPDTETPSLKPSIAVLPFDNIGGDESTARFADGITEDIITDLARYRDVDVIARNSTAVYKGKPADIRRVGQSLRVRYVLEGSVQRQGEQVRITAQLLDARTGAHLWSNRWDRPFSDLFAIQADISEQVAIRLFNAKGATRLLQPVPRPRAGPSDLTAYELYVEGRDAAYQFTKESMDRAISLLRLAVQKDPSLARAWTELAGALASSIDFGGEPAAAHAEALHAAQQAVALHPMDALAHAQLAHQLGGQGDFQRAEAELDTALRLNPGSTDVMTFYITWASTLGHPERGAELVDRVIRLNPDYPNRVIGPFSYAYVMAGRCEPAITRQPKRVAITRASAPTIRPPTTSSSSCARWWSGRVGWWSRPASTTPSAAAGAAISAPPSTGWTWMRRPGALTW